MKTIKLNEGQLHLFAKLIESQTGAPDVEDGDIKEFGDTTENSPTAAVQDDEGNPKYGKMPMADKISSRMTAQNYWANTMNGGRMMP